MCAQTEVDLRPLSIGDEFPAEVAVEHVVNKSGGRLMLSDISDRILILDFIRTSCVSCLKNLPKLDSIQTKFQDAVSIAIVTPEDEGFLNDFFNKRKSLSPRHLSIICNDSILNQIFPHTYIPHTVWIKKGKVVAITAPEYVTEENIVEVMNSRSVAWPVKREVFDFDKTVSIFEVNSLNVPAVSLPRFSYHSGVTGYLSGIPKAIFRTRDTVRKKAIVRLVNYPIIDLYLLASGKPVSFPISKIILEVENKERFVFDNSKNFRQAWIEENVFTYEGCFPISQDNDGIAAKMIADLNVFFELLVRWERRNLPCYVIRRTPGEKTLPRITDKKNALPIKTILYLLNNQQYGRVFFNDSGVDESVLLEIDRDTLNDINLLKKRLGELGLSLSIESREVEVLFITESKTTT